MKAGNQVNNPHGRNIEKIEKLVTIITAKKYQEKENSKSPQRYKI